MAHPTNALKAWALALSQLTLKNVLILDTKVGQQISELDIDLRLHLLDFLVAPFHVISINHDPSNFKEQMKSSKSSESPIASPVHGRHGPRSKKGTITMLALKHGLSQLTARARL